MGQIANQLAIEMIKRIKDKVKQRKEEKRTATTKKKEAVPQKLNRKDNKKAGAEE